MSKQNALPERFRVSRRLLAARVSRVWHSARMTLSIFFTRRLLSLTDARVRLGKKRLVSLGQMNRDLNESAMRAREAIDKEYSVEARKNLQLWLRSEKLREILEMKLQSLSLLSYEVSEPTAEDWDKFRRHLLLQQQRQSGEQLNLKIN